MKKKVLLIIAMTGLLMLLSGCMDINEPINSESEGIWNQYFVLPLSLLIINVADFFNESYGLAIIIVTIFIRLLLLPLNIKQLKSTKAMQDIQPELQALREKYSSKDAKTQQKLQQETMQLFQKHGVNPMAGCLPILVQMPILIAFYHAIYRTESIKVHSFLWFELGSPDPFYILPLIAAGTTYLQQKMMMAGNDAAAQNPQMTMMLYLMPVMIGGFAMFFPAALALYWVVGNFFMIGQTYFIRRPVMNEQKAGGAEK
ncbi:protein translocase subunit yidC [Melghiribacillus thermohalophilus]|uniref:Membrane protein insertase YidC n=1 Tax=Melghiribacillus thermohalophilus TaxID=1324956 RepID=A0A4R3N7U2_9BACI|nr:YidC family membrane integrase SpoIIIJ [Melghiribacillus thermohalophilus]TCT24627.1 protein translocase subunit yidC [Melghiribacillus thermohalophilus]